MTENLVAFDADVHLAETPSDLAPFCAMPWSRLLREPAGNPPWSLDGSIYPRLGPRPAPTAPARSPGELRERLSARGVDAALVLPGPLLKLGVVHSADYAAALAHGYNRWLAERWLDGAPGLFGAILAIPHDPESAAREIEHYRSHAGVAAVCLPTAGVSVLWGDRRYDPIFAAASAARRPVILHGADKLMIPGTTNQTSYFASEFDRAGLDQPLVAMAHLTHLVGTGALARFPELRVLFLGAGTSWLPHLILRLDKEYSENRRDVPFYSDRLSRVIGRQVWVGTHPIEGGADGRDLAGLVRRTCGFNRVLYGSDWPNPGADAPERVAALLSDEAERRQVLRENALDLFGVAAAVQRT